MSQSRQESSARATKVADSAIAQSVVSGSVAGATEVLVNHPLWTIKTRLQNNEPFTLRPSILYCGLFPNMASMVPVTALQVALNTCLQKVFLKDKKELSNNERVASAFTAGVGSSFVSCPTEMLMTYQGKEKCGFYSAYCDLSKQGGVSRIFTALPATAMREGIFTTFFLAVTPIIKDEIKPYCSNDYAVSVMAGISAGVGATLASQAVDTVKTTQQSADISQPLSVKAAVSKLYSEKGVCGFFKGSIPRGARIVSAVTLMEMAKEKMEKFFYHK